MFGLNFFKKKHEVETDTNVQNAFLSLVEKYTNIPSSAKSIHKDISNRLSGFFMNNFDCSLFLVSKTKRAIRFNDEMSGTDFNRVFDSLVIDLGDPDVFSERDGYVWEKDGYFITYGLVVLNHAYEVPMLCIDNELSSGQKIPYKHYITIATAINNTLQNWGIDNHKNNYYKVNYSKEFGFGSLIQLDNYLMLIHFKKPKLSLSLMPITPADEGYLLHHKDTFREGIVVMSDSNIEDDLEKLLIKTMQHHGLKKHEETKYDE